MNILIVAADIPYPTIHGGRVDIYNRLISLKKANYTIDLAITYQEDLVVDDINHLKTLCNEIYTVKRSNTIKADFISSMPWQIENRKSLKDIRFDKEYDIVFLEGDYVFLVLENKSLKYKKAILRVHNVEYKYFFNLALSALPNIKPFFYYVTDAIKFSYFSQLVLYKRVKNLAFISFDEYNYFKSFKEFNSYCLFPSIQKSDLKPYKKDNSQTVLFIGSLFMPNNISAIKWYIKNVHNRIVMNNKNYKLLIAGSTKGKDVSKLRELCDKYDNIELYTDVKDLEELYTQSSVFINPMFHGAGVKIKSINALVNGLPLVSTKVGAEGTGFINKKHVYITDDADEYSRYILTLLEDKKTAKGMVEEAQKYLMEHSDVITLLNNIHTNEDSVSAR